jgi:hypothetical protein
VSESEAKDLNRGRAYLLEVATQHKVPVFRSVPDACAHIVEELRQRAERRGAGRRSVDLDHHSHSHAGHAGHARHASTVAAVRAAALSPAAAAASATVVSTSVAVSVGAGIGVERAKS